MNIRTIKALAAKLGAEIEDTGHTVYAEAPEGQVWQSEGGTLLVAPYSGGYAYPQPNWKREALADLHARMAPGLVPDTSR